MCIMKSEYTLIKGNGSIMYIPHYKKQPTFLIIKIHLEAEISQNNNFTNFHDG